MLMANKVVVLAIFKDEAAADAAAQSVKDSGLAEDDAIGVLVLNDKGEVKVDKVGKRSTGKGAGIGLALALFTPVGLAAGTHWRQRPRRTSPQGARPGQGGP
jgi:hypothetical protein